MQVEMMNRLTAIVPRIDDDTVALIEPLYTSQISGCSHQVTQ